MPDAVAAPSEVQRITSENEARALAHRLLTPGRDRPTVVVTIAAGHTEPFGHPEEIKEAVGDLADVVLMPTGAASWAFSGEMPTMTQVYGGAGRVYPIDHGWVSDPALSRLRFAYSPNDGDRVTQQLIHDALGAAVAGGLLTSRSSSGPANGQHSGTVAGVIGSRALVSLDNGLTATVWEELTVAGVPLDRLVIKGQRVTGAYDPDSRRLDLRDEVRYPDEDSARDAVLDAYEMGDVVLTDVAGVTAEAVRVRLLPALAVEVERSAITSNPYDALPDLFSLGEVVRCRITSLQPLRLRLDDVEDDELPEPAPSLLAGGPPWLRETTPEWAPVAPPEPDASAFAAPPPSSLGAARGSANAIPATPEQRTAPGALEQRRRVDELTRELAAERAGHSQLAGELTALREWAAQLEADLEREKRSRENLQTRYRSADLARQRLSKEVKTLRSRPEGLPGSDGPDFLDPGEQFRYEVYLEWVRRTPAAEKHSRPLADYDIGPNFLASLDTVEGVSRAKVVAVVVEVLTGQVQHLPGREAHRLRAGEAGSRSVTRADGATCWRVALQQETAGARRLHYWRAGDRYELSRVVLHDDYRP